MNKAASDLGKRAKGVRKTLTDEQRQARAASLAASKASLTPEQHAARLAKAWETRRARKLD